MNRAATSRPIQRRAFLQRGALFLAATQCDLPNLLAAEAQPPNFRVGLLTDMHYADKPPAGTRYYRETVVKLAVAADHFATVKPALLVELGDLIDAADGVSVELGYLKRINQDLKAISPQRHYVLGNHCVDTLYKQEFLNTVEQKQSYYSFDHEDVHFVVLDSCFRGDGKPYGRKNSQWTDANLPSEELEWLAADLASSPRRVVVFAHQRLDKTDHHSVKNAETVRAALEKAGNVLAVFQGHSHQNDYQQIAGIHYCTVAAMIEGTGTENNGCATLDFLPSGALRVAGFGRQKSYDWPSA